MDTKQVLLMGLGTISLLLGVLLVTHYQYQTIVDTALTFLISFLLILMGGSLWVGTAVSIMK